MQFAEALDNERENKIPTNLLLGIFLGLKYFPRRFNFNRLPLLLHLQRMEPSFSATKYTVRNSTFRPAKHA